LKCKAISSELTSLGEHVLLDFHGCPLLIKADLLLARLSDAARAAGAEIIGAHAHDFAAKDGATAIVMLAESHISAHTWPEHNAVAIDVFLCGEAKIDRALASLHTSFRPKNEHLVRHLRGAGCN